MTDIHDPCRANMAKADRALRAALDEIERLREAIKTQGAEIDRLCNLLLEAHEARRALANDNNKSTGYDVTRCPP